MDRADGGLENARGLFEQLKSVLFLPWRCLPSQRLPGVKNVKEEIGAKFGNSGKRDE
jgi:hypothetical protein